MKKFVLLFCLLASIVCSAQNNVIKEGSSTLTKDEMWSNVTKLVLSSADGKYAEYKIISSDNTLGQIILELKKESLTGLHWEGLVKMRVCIEMKDEKYRISDIGTKISYKLDDDYDHISSLPTNYLKDMKTDLEVIQSIFYDKKEVEYSSYIYNKDYYGRMLSSTPKYLKPKDEKKNKVNPTYDKYSRIVKACDEVEKTIGNIKKFDTFYLSRALTEKNSF